MAHGANGLPEVELTAKHNLLDLFPLETALMRQGNTLVSKTPQNQNG